MTQHTTASAAARTLRAVDRLEIQVVIDTSLDLLSGPRPFVTSEVSNLLAAGMTEMSGACLCCAAWGLSLLCTVHSAGKRHDLLFDAGPEAYPFERNSQRLGLELGAVGAVVLSHGHFDHAGGLPQALTQIRANNGGHPVPVHVNPGMFGRRGFLLPNGQVMPLADVPACDALAAAGGQVVNAPEERLLLDDTYYLSGEIPRRTAYERGLPQQVCQAGDGNWQPDPLVRDERYLAVHLRDHGVVVFSACSHAGIVNVLSDAAERFAPLPLYAAIGGLHLLGPVHEQWIGETVADLRRFGLRHLIPGHCTGWRATHALLNALGEVVTPSAVGQRYCFG